MSAFLFMSNYSKATREELSKEKDRLISWLKENKPTPGNRFEQDRYGGNWQNLHSVILLLKCKELEESLPKISQDQLRQWLLREGICRDDEDNYRENVIDAIAHGYASGFMENKAEGERA